MAKRSTKASRATKSVRAVGNEKVPVICSECYEDFVFDNGIDGDEIVCPVCEHAADRPDEAQIARISEMRANEKKGFLKAFITFVIAMVGYLSWIGIADSAWYITQTADNQNYLFWGPIAIWGLGSMIMLVFSWKYESDRWEAYF